MLSKLTARLSRPVSSGSDSSSMRCWPVKSAHRLWHELNRRVSWTIPSQVGADRGTLHLMALLRPIASQKTPRTEATKNPYTRWGVYSGEIVVVALFFYTYN